MAQLPTLIYHGAFGLAGGGVLYAVSVTTAALVALLAPTPTRRRDARKVLALLLRRTVAEHKEPRDPTHL